jgi:SAM-dependent methyltransferase
MQERCALSVARDRFDRDTRLGEDAGMARTTLDDQTLVRMRADWDARAETDPLYHIAAGQREWALGDFYASGREIVGQVVDPALASLGADPSGQHVLEIGCGMGRLFEGLADRFDKVSGIDISAQMVALGREHCPADAEWLVGDGATLTGVDDDSIGHVISFEVFQHITDRQSIDSYMREVARVLVPGGTLQIQLRQGSDTRRQAIVRALPRPLRVGSAFLLRSTGVLPVVGDIDSWLGVIVAPDEAVAKAKALGFVDIAVLPDAIHQRELGYWLVARRPPRVVHAPNQD